jgi:hypothetical protein
LPSRRRIDEVTTVPASLDGSVASGPPSPASLEGLAKRSPKPVTGPPATAPNAGSAVTPTKRSPEEVRQMLSRYRRGLQRGKDSDADENSGG